jgi:DNA-binding transcriptional MerR regulator
MKIFTVGEAARELGIELHNLRYLWESNKIPCPRRTVAGSRRFYTDEDVAVIHRTLKEMGRM